MKGMKSPCIMHYAAYNLHVSLPGMAVAWPGPAMIHQIYSRSSFQSECLENMPPLAATSPPAPADSNSCHVVETIPIAS